jgi:alpha-glucuronidase
MIMGRGLVNRLLALAAAAAAVLGASAAQAEDGYKLWLRYAPLEGEQLARLKAFSPHVTAVLPVRKPRPTLDTAAAELRAGLDSLLGPTPHPWGGADIILACGDDPAGDDAFTVKAEGRNIRIAGASERSCLYGAFALLRELSLGRDPARINLDERPAMPLRMLDNWDDPNGYVLRGYSGRSIYDWWKLPEHLDQRLIDYARANASIGINGVVVNSVNASPLFLTDRYRPKLARVADAWRPYGIRLYICARFSAPKDVGGLPTADPLDPAVQAWWKARADALYAAIPDFGGFLVKANSEGEPGPQDY